MGVETAIFATMALAGAATQIMGGMQANKAASQEAKLMTQQAELAQQESLREAEIKARDVRSFKERQSVIYAGQGITLEGTPLLVMEETARRGQEEVDAIVRAGKAQSGLIRARAQQTRRSGRNALFGSIGQAVGSVGNAFVTGARFGTFGGSSGTTSLSNPTAAQPLGPVYNINPAIGG